MYSSHIVGIFAIVFSLSIPIVAILMVFITIIKSKNRDTELRIALVQQGTDAETAKVIIAEEQKKGTNKFATLRWGSAFLGAGLGVLAGYLCGLKAGEDVVFWFCPVVGLGLGLLAAFVIEYRLSRRELGGKEEEQE